MSSLQNFRRPWRGPLLFAGLCLVGAGPVCGQDSSATPSLAVNKADLSLRPSVPDDAASAPSSASSTDTTASGSGKVSVPAERPSTDIVVAANTPDKPSTVPPPLFAPAPADAPVSSTSVAASSTPDAPAISDPGKVAASTEVSTTAVVVAANTSDKPSTAPVTPDALPPATPSQNVTINLINLMVKRNLITQQDAASLIKQAEQEADIARAQAASTQAAVDHALTVTTQPTPAPAPAPAPSGDDEVRIAYVPDVVKKQITDQVTQNVMEQTREEHLADTIVANQVPEWVKRFHVTGDIRVRYEDDMYPSGNAVGNFTNFNSINTSSSGFNVNTGTPLLPQYDVDQDRNRFRLRVRFGAGIDLGDSFTSGIRIATGSDNSPVTENQTFGGVNSFTQGQGGDFGKYEVWLDRAFIRYDLGGKPDEDLSFTIGRFDNPFFHTSMIWADDLAFDGMAVQGKYEVAKGVTPFLTAGAFPVFNTDLNFSTYQPAKFQSEDKYLFAIQGGTSWEIDKDFSMKGAAAFYDFENIQGKVSDPILNAGQNAGNTDDSRPSFAQNGNTYIALRDYQDPTAVPDVTVENQYFGLATPFHVVAVTASLDYSHFDPFHMSITGEFIKNVAFDRNAIINNGPAFEPGPQNNTLSTDPNSFDGGDTGYLVHLDMGKVELKKLWDWNVRLSYRYVQTDATVDGFTDADFGGNLLGTNLKGYTIGGNLALSPRVWAGLRFMSADAVSGPTYSNDLIQFDLNAKF